MLKERILRQPVRSPAPAAVPEAMPPQTTEAAAAGLASGVLRFESRIRARRIGKRAEAARAALASGRIRHAHAAIDEIATIDPEHPAHALLLMELAAHASRGRRRLPFGPVVAAVAVFFGSILVARSADSLRVSAPPPQDTRTRPVERTTDALSVSRPVVSAPATPAMRDEDLVLRMLQQYRRAFDTLDARAAQAVWPDVDGVALRRAFDGLVSQRLTFQSCQLQVNGARASVACRGSAQYTPRVGSRDSRDESREWRFTLRRTATDEWQIASARVAR